MSDDAPTASLRVVLLTTGRRNPFGRAIWARLARGGVVPAGVLLEEATPRIRARDVLVRLRREGLTGVLRAAARKAGIGRGHPPADPSPAVAPDDLPEDLVAASAAAGVPARVVPGVNDEEAVAFLRETRAELVVLGGSRILKRPLLEVPRLGVINAHMAPLPGRRGMNVAEWGLWEGGETGVTVHLVDPGVDTGAVLVASLRPRRPGEDLAAFRRALFALQVELLGRAVEGLREGTLHPEAQPPAPSRQYFRMHPRLRAVLEARLAARDVAREASAGATRGRGDPARNRVP